MKEVLKAPRIAMKFIQKLSEILLNFGTLPASTTQATTPNNICRRCHKKVDHRHHHHRYWLEERT
jgi:hypothetical protein